MSEVIGIDPTQVLTAAEADLGENNWTLGTRAKNMTSDGLKEYIWVEVDEAVTAAGYMVVIKSGFIGEMVDATSSDANRGAMVGAAQAAIAQDGRGWLQIYGKGSVRTLASAALGAPLYSTATPGALDDAATTGLEEITGLYLGTATGGAEATNTDGYFNYPGVGLTA